MSTQDAQGLAAARFCVRGIRTAKREIRNLLESIAKQAKQAQRMSPTRHENLLDVIDAMDNTLQELIALVNKIRRGEVGRCVEVS